MNSEFGRSSNIEMILGQTTFLQELFRKSPEIDRARYEPLCEKIAPLMGFSPKGSINNHADSVYGSLAYSGLFPHDMDPFNRELLVIGPIIAGYELAESGVVIEDFAPQVTSRLDAHCHVVKPWNTEEVQAYVRRNMEYGARLHAKGDNSQQTVLEAPKDAEPVEDKLKIFRDFVNSLDIDL